MEQGPNWQQEKPQQDTEISHHHVCLACKSKANCSCVRFAHFLQVAQLRSFKKLVWQLDKQMQNCHKTSKHVQGQQLLRKSIILSLGLNLSPEQAAVCNLSLRLAKCKLPISAPVANGSFTRGSIAGLGSEQTLQARDPGSAPSPAQAQGSLPCGAHL